VPPPPLLLLLLLLHHVLHWSSVYTVSVQHAFQVAHCVQPAVAVTCDQFVLDAAK
jgi:hypothetical protein